LSRFPARLWFLPLLAGGLIAAPAVFQPAVAAPLPDMTFPATADAYVAEGGPAVAEGSADPTNCFLNDDVGNRKQCLLTFTVSGLAAGDTVTSARILVNDKGNAAGTKLVNVSTVPSSWNQSTVTWNSRPALGATVGSQTSHVFDEDSEFRLTAGTVSGNGTYSFALWSPPDSYAIGMNFHTRENTLGAPAPRLVLSVDRPQTARFPGDPGPGKVWFGLNNATGYHTVEAQLPHPLGLLRIYNGLNWGVPMTGVAGAIAEHKIPYISWKVAPYSVSTVPQSAINTLCANLKSFAPNPIWATVFHEPENDFTTAAQAAAYRSLFRGTVHTCDAMGVTNVAWTEPTLMAPFSFGTASGRNPAWWEPDWKGTSTGTAADWFTGADRVVDILSIDIYVPLLNSDDWQLMSTTLATVKQRWTALGMPLAGRPWAVAEQGVKSDPAQPARGPNAMQDVYATALANGFVGISWWTLGEHSFCHGPVPASDPGCLREQKLAQLVNDPRTAHP
jgi:hypothetical protein